MKLLILFFFISFYTFTQKPLYVKSQSFDALCAGGLGKINLTKVEGGTGYNTYSFLWSDGSTKQNLEKVKVGIYSVIVTDKNGAQVKITDTINEPLPLNITSTVDKIQCKNSLSSINNIVTGGVAPYTFKYFNLVGQNVVNIDSLQYVSPGYYRTRVTDKNGCTTENIGWKQFIDTVNSKTEIVFKINKEEPSNINSSNGKISIEPSNGKEPYIYIWNNGKITNEIQNLKQGSYQVLIKDNNNCAYKEHIDLFATVKPKIVNVYPNPNNGIMSVEYKIPHNTQGVIKIVFQGYTQPIYETNIDPLKSILNIDISHNNLSKGIYIVNLYIDGKVVDSKKSLIK